MLVCPADPVNQIERLHAALFKVRYAHAVSLGDDARCSRLPEVIVKFAGHGRLEVHLHGIAVEGLDVVNIRHVAQSG